MNKLKRFALFATAAMSFLTGCSDSDNSSITEGTNTKTAPKITAGECSNNAIHGLQLRIGV